MRRDKATKPAAPKLSIPPFIQALILEMVKALLIKLLEQIRASLAASSTRCSTRDTGNHEAKRALDEVEEAFRHAIESMKDH